jgi:hypothetical protein
MFLNEEFLKLYEELSILNEAKADTERLIDFAGEELANRFLAIKHRFKAPENDLYYWIKHKTVADLAAAVNELEATKSKRATSRELKTDGSILVSETSYWKVYHITTAKAAQLLGTDTEWCIANTNGMGEQRWNEYTGRGFDFYFFISKVNYDPRGKHSKFALAVLNITKTGEFEYNLYDQQDTDGYYISEIPNISGVNIPGINLDLGKSLDGWTGLVVCEHCDALVPEEDIHWMDDAIMICSDCYEKYYEWEDDETDVPVTTTPAIEYSVDTEDYSLYTDESLTAYKIYTFPVSGDEEMSEQKYSIPFKTALTELITYIKKFKTQAGFRGVTISWSFDIGKGIFNPEILYFSASVEPGLRPWMRYNSRSKTPTPTFVKDAFKQLADAIGIPLGNIRME